MRLMQRHLKELPRRRRSGQKSPYAGHETTLAEAPPIRAQVSPAADKQSIALYGERAEKMYNLNCETGTDLKIGEYVEIDGQDCKVVSVLRYSTHITAVAELAGKPKQKPKEGSP